MSSHSTASRAPFRDGPWVRLPAAAGSATGPAGVWPTPAGGVVRESAQVGVRGKALQRADLCEVTGVTEGVLCALRLPSVAGVLNSGWALATDTLLWPPPVARVGGVAVLPVRPVSGVLASCRGREGAWLPPCSRVRLGCCELRGAEARRLREALALCGDSASRTWMH